MVSKIESMVRNWAFYKERHAILIKKLEDMTGLAQDVQKILRKMVSRNIGFLVKVHKN